MQLIPEQRLAAADKILFIAHLAIGDFTYLQNFFKAFAEANSHLKVHLWIDEVRRTNDQTKWSYLKNYALYDWAENCPFFAKVYRRTYSPALLSESIAEARAESYPLVVSLATLRPAQYARLACEVGGPDAWVVGMRGKMRWYAPGDFLAYRKLHASFVPFSSFPGYHITDVYADWFEQLTGLQVNDAARYPFVDIPPQWHQAAIDQLVQWGGVPAATDGRMALVFINPFAKTRKRCWPVAKVADLIVALQKKEEWRATTFVINATPQEIEHAKALIADRLPPNTHWFSAQQSFFQLPALLQRASLIISVETAVMHLANAVKVPVVALMRRKNPEWAPIDRERSTVIMAAHRSDWVDAIGVQEVLEVLQ